MFEMFLGEVEDLAKNNNLSLCVFHRERFAAITTKTRFLFFELPRVPC